MRRWHCRFCGMDTSDPKFRWYPDDGAVATPDYGCPRCGAWQLEELLPCPDCEGWMEKHEKVCIKCQLKAKGDMARFFRQYPPATLRYMQEVIDDEGLEGLL